MFCAKFSSQQNTLLFLVRQLILCLVALNIKYSILAQNVPKSFLIADLSYLNQAIQQGHPVNYDPNVQVNINAIIEQAKGLAIDSLSPKTYLTWIEKALYHVGCVHTTIKNTPFTANNNIKATFAPFQVYPQDTAVWITHAEDTNLINQKITHINGKPIAFFTAPYAAYKASDGGTNAFSTAFFNFASASLLARALSYPDTFWIKTTKAQYELKSLSSPLKEHTTTVDTLFYNNRNVFYRIGNYAVLVLKSFSKSDISLYQNAFKYIKENNIKNLILDLRQNLGGHRLAAVRLTQFLASQPFSYAILQPKIKTFQYLNNKGKLFFVLSKIKYNLGDFYKARRTSLGRSFNYTYFPVTTNHFDDKLFVLTDGFTVSAATMVTTWLKQYTNAVFLGKQAGGGYNGNNGGAFTLLTLPHSKITLNFPAFRVILDPNSPQRSGLKPDIEMLPHLPMSIFIQTIDKAQMK